MSDETPIPLGMHPDLEKRVINGASASECDFPALTKMLEYAKPALTEVILDEFMRSTFPVTSIKWDKRTPDA